MPPVSQSASPSVCLSAWLPFSSPAQDAVITFCKQEPGSGGPSVNNPCLYFVQTRPLTKTRFLPQPARGVSGLTQPHTHVVQQGSIHFMPPPNHTHSHSHVHTVYTNTAHSYISILYPINTHPCTTYIHKHIFYLHSTLSWYVLFTHPYTVLSLLPPTPPLTTPHFVLSRILFPQ